MRRTNDSQRIFQPVEAGNLRVHWTRKINLIASEHLGDELGRKFAIFFRKRINRGIEKILGNGKLARKFGGGKDGGGATRDIGMEKIPDDGVGMGKVDVAAPDPMIFALSAIVDEAMRLA